MPPPLITAHRGASHEAPENTLAALRLGFAQGADACECDVRLTRDSEVVLMHDANARRTTGVSLDVATATLAELRRLDAGRWKSPAYAGEHIPRLEEALALLPDGRRLVVEIKCGVKILPPLHRVLAGANTASGSVVLMSFDLEVASAAKRMFPATEAHWVVERCSRSAGELATAARDAGMDGLNLDRRFPLDAAFVAAIQAAGLKVHVWTVDDAVQARRLADAGVDSITTNRPAWLRAALGRS